MREAAKRYKLLRFYFTTHFSLSLSLSLLFYFQLCYDLLLSFQRISWERQSGVYGKISIPLWLSGFFGKNILDLSFWSDCFRLNLRHSYESSMHLRLRAKRNTTYTCDKCSSSRRWRSLSVYERECEGNAPFFFFVWSIDGVYRRGGAGISEGSR